MFLMQNRAKHGRHQHSVPARKLLNSVFLPAGAWSFSVSELAAPGVEVGRLTATDPDLGENAQLEFTVLDAEEAEIFNVTGRDKEAVIVLNKVSDETQLRQRRKSFRLSPHNGYLKPHVGIYA